ncbi:uncharacterized protein LOC134215425 [Armigeres subalbatus]|uniref:uncharacterized protein LOC134215425 n=1 Tax=Armigeres subalbatus TaxID=124917 RepID=UPI002ED26C9E
MKHECSNCHVWSNCYRKLTPKLYDYAAERRIKLDKSCSYICNTCYCRLYRIIKKGNEPAAPSAVNIECENQELTVSEPSKLDDLAVAGPSGTNNFAVAGPSRVNNFAAPANINNGGFEIIDPNAAGSSEIDAVPSVESLFSLESTSAESIGSAGAQKPGDGQEILQQMKAKFDEISDRNDRYRILTSLPKSWTAYKMMQEFGVSQRTAQRAKQLQIEKGFMSTPETRVFENGGDGSCKHKPFSRTDEHICSAFHHQSVIIHCNIASGDDADPVYFYLPSEHWNLNG